MGTTTNPARLPSTAAAFLGVTFMLAGCSDDAAPPEARVELEERVADSATGGAGNETAIGAEAVESFAELVHSLPGINAGDLPDYSPTDLASRSEAVAIGEIVSVNPSKHEVMPGADGGPVERGVDLTIRVLDVRQGGQKGSSVEPPSTLVVFIPIDTQSDAREEAIASMEAKLVAASPVGARAVIYLAEVSGELLAGFSQVFLEGAGGDVVGLGPSQPAASTGFADLVATALQEPPL